MKTTFFLDCWGKMWLTANERKLGLFVCCFLYYFYFIFSCYFVLTPWNIMNPVISFRNAGKCTIIKQNAIKLHCDEPIGAIVLWLLHATKHFCIVLNCLFIFIGQSNCHKDFQHRNILFLPFILLDTIFYAIIAYFQSFLNAINSYIVTVFHTLFLYSGIIELIGWRT